MDDLVQFLRAQLDREAARATGWHDLECDIHEHLDAGLLAQIAAARMLEDVPGAVCDCGGPARVLREVEAKRALLSRYEAMTADVLVVTGREAILSEYRRIILPGLALPYADHPDYQETWKP
ncbi:DUF6221 family protein [[Kitasatospora] papulosa]|uniref:DUF6221 family protein n=1 Tax=[Kitasatospora] papulosa TaxID=1464011 RepID=UPI0036906D52